MFVIEITATGTKQYIGETVYHTQNLQSARVFIEKKDVSEFTSSAEEEYAEDIEKMLMDHKPIRIAVFNCNMCGSVRFMKGTCPICQSGD